MTEEEVMKYLNQVAFSSAQEFIEKFKDDAGIIGHFGLGFYSAFMVADKVVVDTLSYQDGAAPVKWSCEGETSYEIDGSDKSSRGTDVTLYLDAESKDFADESKIEELLMKFCKFLPVPIKLGTKKENNY